MLLLLKLLIVPSLVAAVTLVSRRWGMGVGGVLAALPLVAGPTLAFYAVEQGPAFAAVAARTAILGIVANATFCVTYAYSAWRVKWTGSLIAGAAAFGIVAVALHELGDGGGLLETALALTALTVGRRLIRQPEKATAPASGTNRELLLRMIAAAALVMTSTTLASFLGPRASGVISVFPLITLILAAFTHAQRGPASVAVLLLGLLQGLYGFVLFCLVLSVMLGPLGAGIVTSFGAALAAQIVLQAVMLRRMQSGTASEPARIG